MYIYNYIYIVAVVFVVVVVVVVVYFSHCCTKGKSATRWTFEATAGNRQTAIGWLRGRCKPL